MGRESRRWRVLVAAILFMGFIVPCARPRNFAESSNASAAQVRSGAPMGGHPMALALKTTAFSGLIPKKFTCDGSDVSPDLKWSDAPAGTQSFALIADDPDAPVGTWTHWLIWNIPPGTTALPEGVAKAEALPDGARQGQNDSKRIGYGGPCPPAGKPHRYFFKLYALDSKLDVKAGASRNELERAMKGHILGQAEVMGKYGR